MNAETLVWRLELFARGVCATFAGSNAHLFTALAYLVIGGILVTAAVKLWNMTDGERVELLGPYVTDAGWRLVIRHWPFVFLFGAFILSCAADHFADWAYAHILWRTIVTANLCLMLATFEWVIASATAAGVVWIAVKVARGRAWAAAT